jgi:hypothetical protein
VSLRPLTDSVVEIDKFSRARETGAVRATLQEALLHVCTNPKSATIRNQHLMLRYCKGLKRRRYAAAAFELR